MHGIHNKISLLQLLVFQIKFVMNEESDPRF